MDKRRILWVLAMVFFCGCGGRENQELKRLLTTPFPTEDTSSHVFHRGIEIGKAIRPGSESDIALLSRALREGGGQAVSPLSGGEATGESFDPMCLAVAMAMPQCGKQAVPALIENLENGSDSCRFWTITILEKLGPKAAAALPLLTEAQTDKIERIQKAATKAVIAIQAEQQ